MSGQEVADGQRDRPNRGEVVDLLRQACVRASNVQLALRGAAENLVGGSASQIDWAVAHCKVALEDAKALAVDAAAALAKSRSVRSL